MSSLANIPDNMGIRGNIHSNPGKYFISNEIKTAFLRCHKVLTDIQTRPFDHQQKADLVRLVSIVYNRTEKYLGTAIDNQTTYPPLEFEAYFENSAYKEIFESSTNPKTKESYKKQAFDEYTTCDLPSYNTLVKDRHIELLELIQIKEEFCPSLKFSMEQLNSFRLASTPMKDVELEMTDTTFINFFDALQEASEGEDSPVFTNPSKMEEVLDPSDEEVITTSVVACPEETTPPPLPSCLKVTINYNVGFGKTLGICCEPNWNKEPIIFSNAGNDWSGEVPAGKNWKFVILKNEQVILWELGKDRNCEAKTDSSALNYTGQPKFS